MMKKLIAIAIVSMGLGSAVFAQTEEQEPVVVDEIIEQEGATAVPAAQVFAEPPGAEEEVPEEIPVAEEEIPVVEEVVEPEMAAQIAPLPQVTKPKPSYGESAERYKPRRVFEMGIANVTGGFANNLMGSKYINDNTRNGKLTIDLNQLNQNIKDQDIGLSTAMESSLLFFNFNQKDGAWGFGLNVGLDVNLDIAIPNKMFSLLSQGNSGGNQKTSGDMTIAGSIFAAVDIPIYVRVIDVPYVIAPKSDAPRPKLKLGVTPGIFYPVMYIPENGVHYELDTGDHLSVSVNGDINIYSAFNLENRDKFEDIPTQGGFDLTLSGEYPLASWLDAGLTISHIPVVPATLKYKTSMKVDGSDLINDDNLLDGLDMEGLEVSDVATTEGSQKIMRPLRFDLYALYRPLDAQGFGITVRPNLGFTVLRAGSDSFNAGADVEMRVARILYFNLGTGYREGLWNHHTGLTLNFHVIELSLGAALQSQDFVQSFNVGGLSVTLGGCFGF
jgi:hypothetical protein